MEKKKDKKRVYKSEERKKPKYDFRFEKSCILFNLQTHEGKNEEEDANVIEEYTRKISEV